jgi:hypothetical protein
MRPSDQGSGHPGIFVKFLSASEKEAFLFTVSNRGRKIKPFMGLS